MTNITVRDLTIVIRENDYERITADCNTCGVRLFNSDQTRVAGGPALLAEKVVMNCLGHKNSTGHGDFDVVIDEEPTLVEDISIDVTVNE